MGDTDPRVKSPSSIPGFRKIPSPFHLRIRFKFNWSGGFIVYCQTIWYGWDRRQSECSETLEAYAGTHALLRDCREALDTERESVLSGWLEAGEELTPLLIAQAAEAGDGLADDLVMQLARYMGIGTTSLIHTIDPGVVLFGGAMTFGRNESPLGRRFLERVRDEVNQRAFPVPSQNVRIDYASLGGNAGFIGAAGCARLKFGPPS